MYRLLASAQPTLCASLVSDTLDDVLVPLHAISSPFEPGFERVKRFAAILKALPEALQPQAPPPAPAPAPSLFGRLRSLVGMDDTTPTPQPPVPPADTPGYVNLFGWLDETIDFLEAHRNPYILLETIELDTMVESSPEALRRMVEEEIESCRQVGAAFNALPQDTVQAARILQVATLENKGAPLDAFFGLSLNDNCNGTRTAPVDYPLGLAWQDVLYFSLMNREQFAASQNEDA